MNPAYAKPNGSFLLQFHFLTFILRLTDLAKSTPGRAQLISRESFSLAFEAEKYSLVAEQK